MDGLSPQVFEELALASVALTKHIEAKGGRAPGTQGLISQMYAAKRATFGFLEVLAPEVNRDNLYLRMRTRTRELVAQGGSDKELTTLLAIDLSNWSKDA